VIPTVSRAVERYLRQAIRGFNLRAQVQTLLDAVPRKRRAPGQILREMADEAERLSKKDRRADVRAECVKRADGVCECGCGRVFDSTLAGKAEFDHFYGRTIESARPAGC
jgi:hypothetical protein